MRTVSEEFNIYILRENFLGAREGDYVVTDSKRVNYLVIPSSDKELYISHIASSDHPPKLSTPGSIYNFTCRTMEAYKKAIIEVRELPLLETKRFKIVHF